MKMPKRFVIGDIHGNLKGLEQCFQKSGFNPKEDTLVCLGDICDGYPQIREVFDKLLEIKNLIFILGNHDEWAREWFRNGWQEPIWTDQGGKSTLASYKHNREKVPESHKKLLEDAYHIFMFDGENKLFVHGGIDVNQRKAEKQRPEVCLWDRSLIRSAWLNHFRKPDYQYAGYDEIYVGHTTTEMFHEQTVPLKLCNVWAMDTGAGWSGKLSLMDIDTKEYWQSDTGYELYPGHMPRG